MPEKLVKLQRRLGHEFKEPRLLQRALTHRSWAHENRDGSEHARDAQNESLEFVGDSVLGLVIAEELYLKHPTLNEGQLTLMKHRLVSTQTLAKLAAELELGGYLRVGRGEEKTGGREKHALLADALEAVIGAIFFDSGYVEARRLIKKIFKSELEKVSPATSVDYKTLLQEKLQAQRLGTPQYRVTKTEGQPHARRFSVEASWETGSTTGQGSSIKSAEMMAAQAALETLNNEASRFSEMKPTRDRHRIADQHNE